jgi:NAD(P)-dependent dehydrogenase (short-subunit alcohol dehydrogenase family)
MPVKLVGTEARSTRSRPGLTDTAQPRYGSSETELNEMGRSVPLGRMAQPDEIARAAVFLASENAGFVTGQTLHVNGGSYLA